MAQRYSEEKLRMLRNNIPIARIIADFLQRLRNGFGRALNIGFHDQWHFLDFAGFEACQHLFERGSAGSRRRYGLALLTLTVINNLARPRFTIDNRKQFARFGGAIEAENFGRL